MAAPGKEGERKLSLFFIVSSPDRMCRIAAKCYGPEKLGGVMSGNFARSVFVCGLSLAAGLWSARAEAGAIVNYRVLHSFCQATSCADGGLAAGAPAIDANGDLF